MFLAYASRREDTLTDRRVYLPVSWTDDRDHCAAAGLPGEIGFTARNELAADMITAVRPVDQG